LIIRACVTRSAKVTATIWITSLRSDPPPPPMKISLEGKNIVISWSSVETWVLSSTEKLKINADWVDVDIPKALDEYRYTNAVSGQSQFFRVRM
jgi:hypothetical protein